MLVPLAGRRLQSQLDSAPGTVMESTTGAIQKQNLVLLGLGEEGLVQHELIHQPDTTPLALLGEHRDSSSGEGVDVPIDGSLRYLQPLGQLPRSDGPFFHQKV